jgi:hypothetical protein
MILVNDRENRNDNRENQWAKALSLFCKDQQIHWLREKKRSEDSLCQNQERDTANMVEIRNIWEHWEIVCQ